MDRICNPSGLEEAHKSSWMDGEFDLHKINMYDMNRIHTCDLYQNQWKYTITLIIWQLIICWLTSTACMLVCFGKLPWNMGKYVTVDLLHTQPKLVMMSWRYVVINKCIVSSPPYMENGSLGSLQKDTCTQGGKLPCLACLVCGALHGIGLWDLQS